jgi:hypothetical protein
MEDGDSDTDKYPHRTGNIAGHYQLHGTWTVLLLRKPLPCPSPKKGGAFLLIDSGSGAFWHDVCMMADV